MHCLSMGTEEGFLFLSKKSHLNSKSIWKEQTGWTGVLLSIKPFSYKAVNNAFGESVMMMVYWIKKKQRQHLKGGCRQAET